jgi:hypothetical protein
MTVDEPPSRVKSKNLDVAAEFEKSNAKNAANFVVIGDLHLLQTEHANSRFRPC